MLNKNIIINKLKNYFKKREEIAFAFLFGSFYKGNENKLSDIDIAIYFYPESRKEIDFEVEKYFKTENLIWSEIEDILKREVDLIVLNRASSTVAFNAIRGERIIVKDFELYYNFYTYVMYNAIDFNEMILNG